MKDKTYISVIKVLIFAILLTPLIAGGGFSLSFGKTIYFRIVVEAALIFYLLLVFQNKSYLPGKTKLLLAVAIFIASYFISSALGVNPSKSFWGEPLRMGGFITLIHLFAFFIIAASVFNRNDFNRFFKVSVAVAFLLALLALGQKFGLAPDFGNAKPHGTIGNAALFAGYLLPNIFLAGYFLFFKNPGRRERLFYLSFILIGFATVYLTTVRGAWLALFLGSLYFGYSLIKNNSLKRALLAIFLISATGLLLLSFYLKSVNKLPESGPLRRLTDTTTVITRIDGWQTAIAGWRESPKTVLIGFGPENFNAIYNKYFNPEFFFDSQTENYWDRAHNAFMEILSTQGLIGILAFLSVLFYWKDSAGKFEKGEKTLLTALLIAYAVHVFFIFDSITSYVMLFLVLAFIQNQIQPAHAVSQKKHVYDKNKVRAYQTAVLTLILAMAYFVNIKPLSAANKFYQSKTLYINQLGTALEYAKDALAKNTPEKHAIRKEIASLILTKADFSSTPRDIGEEELKFIIREMEQSVEENRLDVFSYLYLGSLYNHYGRIFDDPSYFDKAETLLSSAFKLFPSRQQVYYILADAKIKNGKEDEGLELLELALELNPDSAESYWRLALGYKEIGDTRLALEYAAKAEELVYHGTRQYLPDLLNLIEIYIDGSADFQRIARTYEQAIELRPNYVPFYASLAAVYKELGEFEKAIYYAEKAAELDSSFRKEAENFIRSLNF